MTIQEITNWHLEQVAELQGNEDKNQRDLHLAMAEELVRIERELENKEMTIYYCVFCDNKVGNEKVCLNCNEYKGVVPEAEYNQFQQEIGA
jgi:hypothetical protein